MIRTERGTIERNGFKISWWYEGFTCFHVEKDGQELYHGFCNGEVIRKCGFDPFYDVNDARREVQEMFDEGEGFNSVRIFLNDLTRGKQITSKENMEIFTDIINGKFGKHECSFSC